MISQNYVLSEFVLLSQNCEAVYSSVSGLKAHLANCSQVTTLTSQVTNLITFVSVDTIVKIRTHKHTHTEIPQKFNPVCTLAHNQYSIVYALIITYFCLTSLLCGFVKWFVH